MTETLRGRTQRRIGAIARRNGYSDPKEFIAHQLSHQPSMTTLADELAVSYSGLTNFIHTRNIIPVAPPVLAPIPSPAPITTPAPAITTPTLRQRLDAAPSGGLTQIIHRRAMPFKLVVSGRDPLFEIEVDAESIDGLIDSTLMVLGLLEKGGAS